MAWLRGKVALGSFPDLTGAVNKISESVKNIEKNFDNALGFEDHHQQKQQVAGSASTFDDASQSSSAPESLGERDGNNGKELVLKKTGYSDKHDQYSSGKLEILEKYETSKQKEGADADDATKEHFQQKINETSVGSLKPEKHQDHPVEKNNAISEEADTNIVASHETTAIAEAEANLEAESNANIVEESEYLIAQRNGNSEIGSVESSKSVEEESKIS